MLGGLLVTSDFSPSCPLYPPGCRPCGPECEPEADLPPLNPIQDFTIHDSRFSASSLQLLTNHRSPLIDHAPSPDVRSLTSDDVTIHGGEAARRKIKVTDADTSLRITGVNERANCSDVLFRSSPDSLPHGRAGQIR